MKRLWSLLIVLVGFLIAIPNCFATDYDDCSTLVCGKAVSGNYETGLTIEWYYDFSNLSSSSKYNHFEGSFNLSNVEIVSMEIIDDNYGFIGTVDTTNAKYSLTSKEIFTKSSGKVPFIRLVVKHTSASVEDCKVNIVPTQSLVNINSFTITKKALMDNKEISEIEIGDEFTYQIKVTGNNNYLKTDEVILTDVLPSELEIIDNDNATSTNPLTWNLGSFAAGTVTKTINLKVKLKETTKSSITNTATITFDDDEMSATNTLNIVYSDITITKSASKSTVMANSTYYYKIIVKNVGNTTSKNVTVTDKLSEYLTFEKSNYSYTNDGNNYTFDLGTIAAGASKSILIYVTVKENISSDIKEISNVAIATETGKDPVSSEVTVEITTTPTTEETVDIKIEKSASVTEVLRGEEFTYTLKITNNSNTNLSDILITDELDSNLSFVKYDGDYIINNNTLTFTIDLSAKETKEITFVVKANADAEVYKNIKNKAHLLYNNINEYSNEVTVTIAEITNPKTGWFNGSIIVVAGIFLVLIGYRLIKNKMFKI